MKKIDEFLDEYKKLCEKYNFMIDGCGCEDSPWIVNIKDINEHISHLKKYSIDGYLLKEK